MTPLAQRLYVPSATVAALGTVIAVTGVLLDHYDTWRLGLVSLIAAIPLLCYCLTHRAMQASDDQLATTHSAGYRLALQHVYLGLLDPPYAPPDGGEAAEEDPQGTSTVRSAELPGNVRPLRSPDDEEEDDRKAV